MNAYQLNRLAMCQSVSEVLETTTATGGVPAIADKSAALKTLLSNIPSLVAIQALPTTGNTEDRDRVLGEAIEATLLVAASVLSYANANRLGELAAKVRLTANDFARSRIGERVPLMQQVHDAAAGVLAALASHGITEASLTDLQAKIDAASTILGTPRSMIIARRVATEKLGATFAAIDTLIADEIDPLLFSLRKSHPDDYALYQAARVVINRPGTPSQPAATAPATAPTTAHTA